MSTDIQFILDALQNSSAVEVQVTAPYFKLPTPLISSLQYKYSFFVFKTAATDVTTYSLHF